MPAAPVSVPDPDRRRHSRLAITRPCKLYDPRTGRYHAASTVDLSNGGVLLKSRVPLHNVVGDAVLVGVAMDDRQGLLRANDLIESIVVRRSESDNGGTALAVRFENTGLSLATDLRFAA